MPGMRCLCTVKADMSELEESLIEKDRHWELRFKVVVSFKRTGLQVKLRWIKKVSPLLIRNIINVKPYLGTFWEKISEGPISIIPQSTLPK